MIELHQIAAALYLAAGIGSLLGIVLPSERMRRGGIFGLALGALVHGAGFATLHRLDPAPPLTDLPAAVSLTAWMGVLFLLAFMRTIRLPGLPVVTGFVAFLAVFVSALRLPHSEPSAFESGAWPHAHVLLASGGLGLLGVAGLAGVFFLIEHRRIKAKRAPSTTIRLPTLEALDRVNSVALAVGFPLLTLGVLTGMLWLESERGTLWTGSIHEVWNALAWAIYLGLAVARFATAQGARQAAASAVAGFAFLLFAVVGVGIFV